MIEQMNWISIAVVFINILAFIQMFIDKHLAHKERRRISEIQLLMPVLFSGIIGVIAGMMVFHHKTAKTSFKIKLALTFLLFLATVAYLFHLTP